VARFQLIKIKGIGLRGKREKKKAESIESGVPPAEERKAIVFKSYRDFKEIESYPLYEPWAYARILQHKSTGEIIYYIDEIPLTPAKNKPINRSWIYSIRNSNLLHQIKK